MQGRPGFNFDFNIRLPADFGMLATRRRTRRAHRRTTHRGADSAAEVTMGPGGIKTDKRQLEPKWWDP